LALIWALSLRPVRTKIADYYFSNGNFDQAINWYARVVRKEKAEIDYGKGVSAQFAQDLSKLRLSIVAKAEASLLTVSKLIGFTGDKDLRSSLSHESFFPREMDHLLQDTSNRLKIAKGKLMDLSNLYRYFNSFSGKETFLTELDYIASLLSKITTD